MTDIERTLVRTLDERRDRLADLARAIWARPETALQERFASQSLAAVLSEAGFAVAWGAGGMDTAFVAEWGAGGPVIGLLGEYDALPGLSQDARPERHELVAGGPGHGCGHNLYGVAAMASALALQAALRETGRPGTVRFYGCPAEETLTGKTYMARDGVFDDLDAAVTWHPSSVNGVWANGSSLAMYSFQVHFRGVASHGAADPHRGRSALDGAMLMDVGVNYLREHVIPDARIHAVITHGGQAPNVVPPKASIWYFVRAPRRDQVEAIYQRVLDCARGAALMSGTEFDVEFLTACAELLPNETISALALDAMDDLGGGPAFDAEELAFAAALQATVDPAQVEADLRETLDKAAAGTTRDDLGAVLCQRTIRPNAAPRIMYGSTEVGDVSQIAPTANLLAATHPHGTPAHSWQLTASAGSAVGLRGMDFAARAMALTAWRLIAEPETLRAARTEFEAATGGRKYVSPLPDGARPK